MREMGFVAVCLWERYPICVIRGVAWGQVRTLKVVAWRRTYYKSRGLFGRKERRRMKEAGKTIAVE